MGLSLVSIGVDLAKHFVGQHVLRKSYESCDLRGKEKWVMTLSAESSSLSSSKEGRSSLQLVQSELYLRDPSEWRSLVKKQVKAGTLLMEMEKTSSNRNNGQTGHNNSSSKGKNDSIGSNNNNKEENKEVVVSVGKKRKRKRHNKATHLKLDNDEDDE